MYSTKQHIRRSVHPTILCAYLSAEKFILSVRQNLFWYKISAESKITFGNCRENNFLRTFYCKYSITYSESNVNTNKDNLSFIHFNLVCIFIQYPVQNFFYWSHSPLPLPDRSESRSYPFSRHSSPYKPCRLFVRCRHRPPHLPDLPCSGFERESILGCTIHW